MPAPRLLALVLLGLLVARPAQGAPARLLSAEVADPDGHHRILPGASADGHPIAMVLVLEDAQSSKQKQPAHAVVGRYSDNPTNRSIFEFCAIADLERYDYWPVRRYALAAVRKSGLKASTTIWIDWHGVLRRSLGLRDGQTGFVVLAPDGAIRWFGQGMLDGAQQQALDAAIAALGAKPAPGR